MKTTRTRVQKPAFGLLEHRANSEWSGQLGILKIDEGFITIYDGFVRIFKTLQGFPKICKISEIYEGLVKIYQELMDPQEFGKIQMIY